ncbi:S41 family peptidase [Gracilimonas mengyeensis]|uniref:C-terminal processing peptidase-3. Serine peptidase. MEROPS family S41A n=1 Tax=Gracilimonas mengyeensis TaxID=1302730 RepID=A0A521FIS3_9BACT|nr:S41 family peptidase [Gracilimonas mengyeensis]SMO96122.1 C-terminal processing peptidase-3. Serine peptidase. MEROPS family S41A [Gracilimonas mengyeensis]
MTLKKFLYPNLFLLLLFAVLRFTGVDPVLKAQDEGNDDTTNLTKYVQAQRSIVTNYFGEPDLTEMYKASVKRMVQSLKDSTLAVDGTPIDTTFQGIEIGSIRDSFSNFEKAYLYIANNSPESDMAKLTDAALRGMFSTLDPHSMYIEPEDNEEIQAEFDGKFQGIGVQFNIIQDTITVITAISGGPSEQLGIRSGDRIIAIEDSSAIGYTNEMVLNKLRGEKGTKVDVTIKRPHVKEPINFTITRDDIPLYTVDTSYKLDEKTGYVKINRFAATTHSEFMEAVSGMQEEGMERLVLDLRNNPGGYLSQAIAIAEEFFPRGTQLVSTKSKHTRFNGDYDSRKDGKLRETPVIVLVNEGSASASEIVSGAIQDHDRGLIVGKRTFGKGLVQQQYELVDNSSVRVTISRYYTPSGRMIQKPFVEGGEEYAYEIYRRENNAMEDASEFIDHVPDSLKYSTDAGRTVYGGGGIVPDYIVPDDTTTSAYVFNFAMRNQVFFEQVREILDDEGEELRSRWEDDFEEYREEFTWEQRHIDSVKSRLLSKGMVISDTVKTPDFRNDSLFVPTGHFEEVSWLAEGRMKAELARQIWGMKYFYPVINDVLDTTLDKAMSLWDAVARLEAIADGKAEANIGNLNLTKDQ